MTETETDSLTLRATVIAGTRYADDYAVIWRGMSIGRIMRGDAPHLRPPWQWSCHVHGRPQGGGEYGSAADLDEAKAQFKAAWERTRAGLTDQDIAKAHRIAETSAEALARYERKGSL